MKEIALEHHSYGYTGNINTSPPPKAAAYLLYLFLKKDDREQAIGDLDEDFAEVCEKFGVRRARFWYWYKRICEIWPAITALCKRLALAGGIEKIWGWLSHVKW